MASSRLASNLTEDYLTCSVCFERFENPRSLRCDHSFCLNCLLDIGYRSLKDGSQLVQIQCPLCRKETELNLEKQIKIEDALDGLPVDMLLDAILKTVQEHSSINTNAQLPLKPKDEHSICLQHNLKKDLHCFEHGVDVCTECAWAKHDKCDCCSTDEYDTRVDEQIRTLKGKVDKTREQISATKVAVVEKGLVVDQNKRAAEKKLQELQSVLQQFWARAQYEIQHLSQTLHEKERDFKQTNKAIVDVEIEIDCITEQLGNLRNQGKSSLTQAFLTKNGEQVEKLQRELKKLAIDLDKHSDFELKCSSDVISFCQSCTSLGSIVLSENAALSLKEQTTTEVPPEEIRSDDDSWSVCSASDFSDPDVVQSIGHISVHVADSKSGIYSLSDVCIMNNLVLVIDQHNSNIYLYDVHQGICHDSITLKQQPHKMSLIPDTSHVMMTSWSANELYKMATHPKLKIIEGPISTKAHYIAIDVVDKTRALATSLERTIDVINLQGEILMSIRPKQTGFLCWFSILMPADICRVSDTTFAIYDCIRKTVTLLDFDGKVKWSRTIKGLSGIYASEGRIYICNGKNGTMSSLDLEGRICERNVVPKSLGINRPWAIGLAQNHVIVTEDSPSGRFHIVNIDTEETLQKD